MRRILAISDIHGCLKTLVALIEKMELTSGDTLIFCGDYCDRGPDSKGVIDYLIGLGENFNCHFIEGNHDEMFGTVLRDWYRIFSHGEQSREGLEMFGCMLQNGGQATFDSYGIDIGERSKIPNIDQIPKNHIEFFKSLVPSVELNTPQGIILFTHASLPVDLLCHVIDLLPSNYLKWSRSDYGSSRDRERVKEEYFKIVYGHTVQPMEPKFDEDYAIGIDGGCCFAKNYSEQYGKMFCVDVITGAWTNQEFID